MQLTVWTYEGPPHVGAMRHRESLREIMHHRGTISRVNGAIRNIGQAGNFGGGEQILIVQVAGRVIPFPHTLGFHIEPI